MGPVQHPFQAEVSQVLRLVINSLYGNKEIFLRELVSNASDALDRRRFAALQQPELLSEGETLKIRMVPDKAAGTLTIWDNGIGMTEEELKQNLGTIAWSGSRDFLQKLEGAERDRQQDLPQLIGQFGVGFYSAYLVADRVEVVSRASGSEQAFRWASSGQDGFTLEPAERENVGTSIVLHLKADQREYLESHRLRALVQRYSDFISYSIELPKTEGGAELEVVNRGNALWQRSPREVEKEQYVEFYKHLTHDWEEPLAHRHFHIEGTQMFAGILYVPKRPPMDLFDAEPRHGVRLHVKRVFVMDDCDDLVPRWLRFVRGVIDSEDLPLNVSREILQDSRTVRIMRKQVVQQTFDLLAELARDRPSDYLTFWSAFGAVLKEGLHFEPEYEEKLAKLLRYSSAAKNELISLDDYVSAMPEGQPGIYYITGTSRQVAASSPHLERVRSKGYDVLIMSDAVDSFAVASLTEFAGKPLLSVTSADLKLPGEETDEEKKEPPSAQETSLLARIARVLEGKVAEVRPSKRLTDSPACLVTPEGGLSPHIERLLRAQKRDLPASRRIL
ncbi:MAG TPA: molecular chaperone HtpG, partial [Polyangiaceae bacterium]|nr:molecular chaperone HtpG [Polyangiaceae bacterium]